MPVNATIPVDLAVYGTLEKWKPAVGDVILCNGFFKHWYGIICDIDSDGTLTVRKKTVPVLLFTDTHTQNQKDTIKIHLDVILSSNSGKYAIIQSTRNGVVWYL